MKRLFHILLLMAIGYIVTSCVAYKKSVTFDDIHTNSQAKTFIEDLEIGDRVVVKLEDDTKSKGKITKVNKENFIMIRSERRGSHKGDSQIIDYQDIYKIKYKTDVPLTIIANAALATPVLFFGIGCMLFCGGW
jgi:hypothetical protein